MGGKAQQRVAGNAKPANSGRIRELLVSRQVGASVPGNIITFSALSNKIPTQPQAKSDTTASTDDNKHVEAVEKPKQGAQETLVEDPTSPRTSVKDNYKLVVRRVGNRDLYTRVKLSDEEAQSDNSIKPAVSPSEAGVKKPSYSLSDSPKPLSQPDSEASLKEPNEEEDAADDESETDSIEEIDAEFDDLIERLDQIHGTESPNIDSLTESNEQHLERENELIQLLSTLVKRFNRDMSIEEWDLIVSSLYKWIGWIGKAGHPVREKQQLDFSVKVFKFVHHLIRFAENLKSQQDSLVEFPMLQSILDDWGNFQASNMFQELLILYFKLISLEIDVNSIESSSSNTVRPIIESLAHIIIEVDPRLVLSHHSLLDYLSFKVEFDQEFKEPKNSIYCHVDEKKFKSFHAVCGLLKSNFRVILVSAHAMLGKTIGPICENAIQAVIPTQDQEQVVDEDIPIFPPAALVSILTSRDSIMSTLLSDYRVGDTSVTIEPSTDAYSCTLSYLFTWDLVIQFIVGVEKEIGHKIIHTLKRLGLIQRLLDNIFILLPPLGQQDTLRFRIYKSAPSSKSTTVANIVRNDVPWNLESFLKSPLRTTVKRPLNEIELIALHLYFSVALHMPVTVRKWYNNNANKRLCNLVNEYTVKHVSRVICSLEMESVQQKCQQRANQNLDATNLTIKARPSANEVYAIYHRDEFQMELTIKLPQNYPLGAVQIDGGKRVGVTDVKWRSWLLQLTTFLAHQNGPILDGIDLWRKNIDKRFEGVAKCTICFSILHSNYQLPKKKCQTCANMFHNLCLFKWFESSGNSTCPLCRNPW